MGNFIKTKKTNNAVAEFYQFLQKVDPITRNCLTSITSTEPPHLFEVGAGDPPNDFYGEGLLQNILYNIGY